MKLNDMVQNNRLIVLQHMLRAYRDWKHTPKHMKSNMKWIQSAKDNFYNWRKIYYKLRRLEYLG